MGFDIWSPDDSGGRKKNTDWENTGGWKIIAYFYISPRLQWLRVATVAGAYIESNILLIRKSR